MNKYVKEYLLRGLIFSGFGPIIAGIIYLILEIQGTKIELSGLEIFSAILTTYICAFVHAGSSVFPQIEHFSKIKAMFFQFISIYSVYTIGYLINSWIPLNPVIILIYTGAFVATFLVTWLVVFLMTRKLASDMNDKLKSIKSDN